MALSYSIQWEALVRGREYGLAMISLARTGSRPIIPPQGRSKVPGAVGSQPSVLTSL